jgi:Protein of unknown function (DUF3631)
MGGIVSSELDEALEHLTRYFGEPNDETAWTHALYAAYTHKYQDFRHAPRLVIDSPERGSGKSVLAEDVLGGICHGAYYTADTTPAAIYQVIGEYADAHTIAIDEMDMTIASKSADGNEKTRALMQLINAGYKRGGVVWRGGEKGSPRSYDVFRPVVLVGITFWSKLPAATQSRCIRTTVIKAKGAERTGTERFEQDQARTRAALAAWADTVEADPFAEVPHADQMDQRTIDTWTPLVAMANAAGGPWPQRAAACIERLAGIGEGGAAARPKRFVTDLARALADHERTKTGIAVAAIRAALVNLGEPWNGSGRWHEHGQAIDDNRVRDLLGDYGVATHKSDGRKVVRWTDIDRILDAYLPPDGDNEAAETSSAFGVPEVPGVPAPHLTSENTDINEGPWEGPGMGFGGYRTGVTMPAERTGRVPTPADVEHVLRKTRRRPPWNQGRIDRSAGEGYEGTCACGPCGQKFPSLDAWKQHQCAGAA